MPELSPKAVSVLVHRNANVVRLVVEDDGKGFDVTAAQSDKQLGLVGMRERARLAGAAVDVESRCGNGTVVELRLQDPDRIQAA